MSPNKSSIVQYLSEEKKDLCGYCKTKLGSARYGLWAFQLTVEDYQALIDRGWRRSGHYCYKPIIQSTCCPMFTIRCSALNFKPTKSQKRVMKRFDKFINFDIKTKYNIGPSTNDAQLTFPCSTAYSISDDIKQIADVSVNPASSSTLLGKANNTESSAQFENCKTKITVPDNPNSAKKRQIRINKKREKLKSQGLSDDEIYKKMIEKKRFPVNKNVEDFMNGCNRVNAAHKLEVKVVRSSPRSQEFQDTYELSYSLYKRYQVSIHKDAEGAISKKSFDRFLVDSPLIEDLRYGSFHQQYWIDGKLIAVGVIDILPKCVSSVYLFYDPDYAFLSLGTYSALRELFFVRSLVKSYPDLVYYYMGYYIESCPKMRYKGAFHPSFLLCPEVYSWHPIENCIPKIVSNKGERLSENVEAQDEAAMSIDINNVPVLYNRKLQLAGVLPSRKLTATPLREYCLLVGSLCSTRIILNL